MSADTRAHLTDRQDTEIAEYHAPSKAAVAGLILGLLSPTALVDPLAWAVPALGIVCSAWGLWQIARNPAELVGRKAAVAGLVLSVLFGAAAVGDRFAYRWMVRREARQFAGAWFELLARGDTMKAHQLTLQPRYREPLDERLEAFYREGPRWQKELEDYGARPLVRQLLEMADKAEARYRETAGQGNDGRRDHLVLIYTLSGEHEGRQQELLVAVDLEREKTDDGTAHWRVLNTEEAKEPEEP